MASNPNFISSYVNELAGKTFPSNYFFEPFQVNGGGNNWNSVQPHTFGAAVSGFNSSTINGTVQVVDAVQGTFSIGGVVYQAYGATEDGKGLIFGTPPSIYGQVPFHNEDFHILYNTGQEPEVGAASFDSAYAYTVPNPTCFIAGTMILTTGGERAVEDLREGDTVVTADGREMPIKWIGHRHTECATSPWRKNVSPIRIERHALALCVPSRPLTVSPGHSLEVEEGWLIQAEYLVNGKTIIQVDVPSVTYWHVELDEHAILVANGTNAESFIDVGNRSDFDNGGPVVVLHPRFIAEQLGRYCMPIIQDRTVIDRVRDNLDARADALGEALKQAA